MGILITRRILTRSILVLLLGLSLSCSKESFEPEPVEELKISSSIATTAANSKIVEDRYIVVLSKKPAEQDSKAEAALIALEKEVGNMAGARIKSTYRLALTGFSAKLNQGHLEKLKRDSRVLAIYPDQYIELENVEDLSAVSVQEYPTWGLDRMDQREKILDRAYSFTSTGSGVNVYIMDSGIRYSHEEFGTRASLGVDFVKDFPDAEYDQDEPDLEPGNDCNGHGTHVAGTVGGSNYGVAKSVNLISVRVFSCVGRTTWTRIIQAIEWITANAEKPAVVNMSLGGGAYEPIDTAVGNSVSSGINYTISAGNSNDDACKFSPARFPGAITVGATQIDNLRASFSNFGDCLDVYAPGAKITSASHKDDTSAVAFSGTSMAAPHVAGLAALYLQNNPGVTPAALENEIILNSTPNVVEDVPSGPNRMVYSLWEPVVLTPPVPPDLNLRVIGIKNKNSNQVYLVWDPTDDPFVNIYRNGSHFARWYNSGEYSLNINGKGGDTFMVCEINYDNCSANLPADFSETDYVPNQPPTAAFSYEVNDLEVTFTDQSTDSDGTIIERRLFFGDGYYTMRESPVYTYREPGTYRVQLEVVDNHHATDFIVKEITVGTVVPSPESIELSAVGTKMKGQWQTDLSWTPAGTSALTDIYKNGAFFRTVNNTGSYRDLTSNKGGGTLEYRVCEAGTTVCSNTVIVQF